MAGSVLAIALQTSVFAQAATNMVNFYASSGQTLVGPAATGSTNDIWNPLTCSWGFSGTASSCVDVLGNSVSDQISVSGCGGFFTGDPTGPETTNLFGDVLLDYCGTSISVSISGLATNADYVMYNYTIGSSANTGGTLTWIDGAGKTNIATADNTTYTPTSFVLNQNYTVLTGQSDANGEINFSLSDVADPCWNGMQIYPAPPVPTISHQPQSTTNSLGSMARFIAGATGVGLTYQWSLTNGTILTNCASATLTISNVAASDAGGYIVTIKNSQGGTVTSQPATLTISSEPLLMNVQVNINGNGGNTNYAGAGILGYSGDLWNQFTIAYGVFSMGLLDSFENLTPVTFSLANTGGSGNDSTGDDGNGAFSLLTSYYDVTNAVMTITLAGLNINAVYTIITYDAGGAYGQGATLGGDLTGTAPGNLTFAKLNLGDDCLENTNIITDNYGNVTFTVTPSSGQQVAAFNGLQIELQSIPAGSSPVVSQVSPQNVSDYVGQSVTFSARAISVPPITSYQWLHNNAPLKDAPGHISGSSTPVLAIRSQFATDAGTYTIVVNNGNGASSNSATLTVSATVPPPATNLVGAWLTGATNLADTSGYQSAGLHGGFVVTSNGITASHYVFTNDVPSGTTGQSLWLYSNDTAIAITNSSDLDGNYTDTFDDTINTNGMSVACWAKGVPGAWIPWVSKYGGNVAGWQFGGNASGNTPCWAVDETSGAVDVSSTLGSADGNWHFYAGVYSPVTGDCKLYVDGVLAAQATGQGPLNPSPDSHLVIGGQDAGGNAFDNYFTGEIYGVRIYKSELSAAQVNYLFTPVAPSVPSFSDRPILQGTQFVLSWSGGSLLQATNVMGPWMSTGATSPFTNDFTTSPQMFYKLSNP